MAGYSQTHIYTALSGLIANLSQFIVHLSNYKCIYPRKGWNCTSQCAVCNVGPIVSMLSLIFIP